VIDAQTELAQRQAELRQQQLVAEVVKPAEADPERVRVLAKADAERVRIQAEADASHNGVAPDRMLIDQLPQIVREAATGLANADITVLNGADGLTDVDDEDAPAPPGAGNGSGDAARTGLPPAAPPPRAAR